MLNIKYFIIQTMDYRFIQGISDIQQTQAMTGSRTTLPFSPRNHVFQHTNPLQNYLTYSRNSHQNRYQDEQQAPSYSQLRDYIQKTLTSWGLKLGYLPENSQNKYTIQAILQLITNKFKDQESRQQLKKSLSEAVFQRNKYQSFLQQQKSNVSQKNKLIGRLQNNLNEIKHKAKLIQINAKKQRDEDKKLITMLKNKNQQILHQMKKRQQQTNRVKQQMKKNVGQKGALKNVSFQVYEALSIDNADEATDKINALSQKYQTERKLLIKQNLLLRQKLYDIRQEIVGFAEWVDVNLFRQKNVNYKNKFVINHNLLFKKQSIVQQFNQIISDAKKGMMQLINICQTKNQDKNEKLLISTQPKNYEQNCSPNKQFKKSNEPIKQPRQTMPTMQKNPSAFPLQKTKSKQKFVSHLPGSILKKKQSIKPQPQVQTDQEEQSEISIISHISIKDILNQNQNFDKWDAILNNQ